MAVEEEEMMEILDSKPENGKLIANGYYNKKYHTETVTSDEFLKLIGEYGKFQKLLNLIVCVIYYFVGFQVYIAYFLVLTPTWFCKANSTSCTLNGTQSEENLYRCRIPRSEWEYTEPVHFSVVTEFDIDCKEQWLLRLVSSMNYIGWGLGSIILGLAGDRYGRKVLLFPSMAIIIVLGTITPYLPNIFCVIVVRFVIGFFIPGVMIQSYILLSEFVGSKRRPLATLLPFIPFSLGFAMLSVKAYIFMNWEWFSIICVLPYLPIFALYVWIPESASWLQKNNRHDEAVKIFQWIGKFNGKETGGIVLASQKEAKVDAEEHVCDTRMIFEFVVLCFVWFVSTLCNFGIHFAADQLEGSIYRDFALLSIAQIPGAIIAIYMNIKFGRKKTNLISLFIAGLTCLLIIFIPTDTDAKVGRIILGILGKIAVNVSYQSLYLWSVEILPLSIRSQGMGFTQVSARLGATLSPWVVKELKSFGSYIPFIVLAVPTFVGCALGFFLPETKVKKKKPLILEETGKDDKNVIM